MNIDESEIKKFAELADKWWDKNGDFKPLHVINPLRANYIFDKLDISNKKVVINLSSKILFKFILVLEFISNFITAFRTYNTS